MSAVDMLSWAMIGAGAVFSLIGGVGLLRLPDFYARTHAGGLTDTVGASFLLLGMLLQAPDWIIAFKLILIGTLLYVTTPTATHALVKAAYARGVHHSDDD